MIVDALLSMLIAIVSFAKGLVPDWAWVQTAVDPMHNPVANGGGYIWTDGTMIRQWCRWIAGWNDILPVTDAVYISGLVLAWFSVLAGLRLGRWLIGVVRGSGTA